MKRENGPRFVLTLEQEYRQWVLNYEILLKDIQAAYKFKNALAVDKIGKRIMNTQAQIAMCARKLEEKRKANARSTIRPSVDRDIEVREYTPVDFSSVRRNGRK